MTVCVGPATVCVCVCVWVTTAVEVCVTVEVTTKGGAVTVTVLGVLSAGKTSATHWKTVFSRRLGVESAPSREIRSTVDAWEMAQAIWDVSAFG